MNDPIEIRVPPDDPRAICGHCDKPISEVDLRFDRTPAGSLLLTFRCKNCHVFQGHQVVPEFWVVPMTVVDGAEPGQPGSRDIANLLADLRNPKKRS